METALQKIIYENPSPIDVEPYRGFSYVGEWAYTEQIPSALTKACGSMWMLNARPEHYCQYNPGIYAKAQVRISAYVLFAASGSEKELNFQIHHNHTVDFRSVPIGQLTCDQWAVLGTFDFSGTEEEEFVRLCGNASCGRNTYTRAAAMRFEIMNNALSGGIWQTVYVAPDRTPDQICKLEMLDRFTDLKNHSCRYDVEYLASRGFLTGTDKRVFSPDQPLTGTDFLVWLTNGMAIRPETITDRQDKSKWNPENFLSCADAVRILYQAARITGKNTQWMKFMPDLFLNCPFAASLTPKQQQAFDFIARTGILNARDLKDDPRKPLSRARGVTLIKRFLETFVWAGPPVTEDWVLTFDDEFSGTDMDWNVWISDNSYPHHILSSRWKENISVSDSCVRLLTKKENRGGAQWTTGNIWVNPQVFRQAYGYWEARYRYTAAEGINNAFWCITRKNMVDADNQMFELDINEGHYKNKVNTTYHSWFTGERIIRSEKYLSGYDLSADFHTYALEWNKDSLISYFDGKVISVKKNENASVMLFPFLSTAITNWAGTVPADADGTSMDVDYVRIWQRSEDLEKYTFTADPSQKQDF